MWWSSEFVPPAPGHSSLETMTQQDYHFNIVASDPDVGSSIDLRGSTEEIIRVDQEGFHYNGQFIADTGEAHRLLVEFLKKHTA